MGAEQASLSKVVMEGKQSEGVGARRTTPPYPQTRGQFSAGGNRWSNTKLHNELGSVYRTVRERTV